MNTNFSYAYSYGKLECRGWWGGDRRCECGNRRVYWQTEMINGLFTMVATAY